MFEHVSELRTHAVDKEQISEFASVVFIVYCELEIQQWFACATRHFLPFIFVYICHFSPFPLAYPNCL